MGYSCWQNEVLVSRNGEGLSLEFVESMAFDAIDKNILIDAFLTYAVVVFCHGIIAYICDEETTRQRIFFLHFNEHRR